MENLNQLSMQLWEVIKPLLLNFGKEIIGVIIVFILSPTLVNIFKSYISSKFRWIPSGVYSVIENLVFIAYEKFAGIADDGDDKKTIQEKRRDYVIEKVKAQYPWLPISVILTQIDKAIISLKAESKKNEALLESL
jgi:hypothetical protein